MKLSESSCHYKLTESVFPNPSRFLGIYVIQFIVSGLLWAGTFIAILAVKMLIMLPMIQFTGRESDTYE